MKQDGLSYFTDTYLTVIGLLIFFCFFVGTIIWVYRKSSSEIYVELQAIPLNDGDLK